ncbi:MAG: serine hydrolase [Bacteroidota bacterium]
MRISPFWRRTLTLLVLLVVLLFAGFLWQRPLLHIGAGYAAKHACSCHFLQGRELEEIREHDLNFSVLGQVSLSVTNKAVTASFYGLTPRRAVYREGKGCTLINDEDWETVDLRTVNYSGAVAGAGGRTKSPTKLNPALDAALDYGMAPVPGGGARGLVIMQNGVVIGERYATGYDADTPLLGWSMTKTLTALLYGGTLPFDGSANITADVARTGLFQEWAQDERNNISVADLLHMNSGLAWNEAYGAISDATIMLHEQPYMAAYAAGMPTEYPPGEVWKYSSGTTNVLIDLTRQRIDPVSNMPSYVKQLFGGIAPSLLIEQDQRGNPVGSSYGWATARDWARLGQFMLQDGVWEGDTLLPPGWIDWLREPAAGSGGVYGGQTWLPGPDMPSLPKDAFLMRGFQDQRVIVIPSRRLVVARLGHNDDQVTDFDGLVARVLGVVD